MLGTMQESQRSKKDSALAITRQRMTWIAFYLLGGALAVQSAFLPSLAYSRGMPGQHFVPEKPRTHVERMEELIRASNVDDDSVDMAQLIQDVKRNRAEVTTTIDALSLLGKSKGDKEIGNTIAAYSEARGVLTGIGNDLTKIHEGVINCIDHCAKAQAKPAAGAVPEKGSPKAVSAFIASTTLSLDELAKRTEALQKLAYRVHDKQLQSLVASLRREVELTGEIVTSCAESSKAS